MRKFGNGRFLNRKFSLRVRLLKILVQFVTVIRKSLVAKMKVHHAALAAFMLLLFMVKSSGVGVEDVLEKDKMPFGTKIEILRAMAREAATFSTAAAALATDFESIASVLRKMIKVHRLRDSVFNRMITEAL